MNAFQNWRHLAILLGMWCLVLPSFGQLYVGLGFQAGFGNMPNANVPVDRFNNRGFLSKRMGKFHFPAGEIYDLSIRPGRLLLGLNLNTKRQRISAESFDANTLIRRDIRFVVQAISVSGGYDLANKETFACYLGGSVDLGYMRLLTRFGPKQNINQYNYGLLGRRSMIAGTAFVKMVFMSSRNATTVWSLSPYVQFPFQQFNFLIMNQVLNTATYQLDGFELFARPTSVGIALNFDLELLNFLTE
jgi:hypothetical protein